MAGVVAMASVIEDFDKQPCKKSRKDGGSPVVKTITNYFSPVAKPVEKPFSPPRSNNIMDYFSRKAPASKERSSTPEQAKENSPQSASAGKQSSQKRGGKSSKIARKLVAIETVDCTDEGSCIIIEDSCDSKDLATKVSNHGVLGSDTAVLLAQVCSQSCATAEISAPKTDGAEEGMEVKHDENAAKCRSSVERKPSLSISESSPIAPSRNEVKPVKSSARNAKKKPQEKTKPTEKVESEMEMAMCDLGTEASPDEASPSNNSTVTISFEDFVRSQGEENADEQNGNIENEFSKVEPLDANQVDICSGEEDVGSGETSGLASPRTVTVRAEVHTISPKQESTKMLGKIASIFNQRKGANSPKQVISADTVTGQQSPSLIVKRKSNVVLEEEDLELAEIESESAPKCSEAEKKQFMAAFKQPNLDGSKTKPAKSQVKQKQIEEKTADAEDDAVIPVDEVAQASKESTAVCPKSSRRGRNKAKMEKETEITTPAAAAAVVDEIVAKIAKADDELEEPAATSSVQPVRRSRRENAGRKTPETKQTAVRTTRKRCQSKAEVAAAEPLDSPVTVSTPKTRRSKRDVFVAEVMTPPDAKGSPIRIKLTRVQRKSEDECTSDKKTTSKTSDDSEKRKQAKRLVEKAKVVQSKKTSLEEKSTLRRSSRTEASVKRSYCEDEDSIVFIGEAKSAASQKATEKSKNQKSLRSLNDVLGRAAAAGNEAKAAPGSKATEKTGRKVSAVISIFDDSSRDDSENSQDDEQFKARREFLKSGLPESFRKQIAKTAATKEAYSLSCSSFQPVTHTTQPPDDCLLWSLPWPESSLLCHLKAPWSRTSSPYPSVSGSLFLKTETAPRSCYKRSSGQRSEISESVRQLLMEELGTSNPQFPAQMFMTRFQKRRADYQQQCKTSEAVTGVKSSLLPAEPVCGKRKRRNDGEENTAKGAKKLRSNQSEENGSAAEAQPSKRGRRSRRSQKSEEEKEKTAPIPVDEDSVVILDDLVVGEVAGKKDEAKEDVLWTDKYQPQHSADIIDNTASVKRLHSWLKEWKLRADREERKKQKDKKREEDGSDSEWDGGEEDGEDMLCNTMILTGPTGVGKTAAVYACAQELGFKVFEVNASSQRSGRLILSQLKEATQSHQVDSQGAGAHKPSYFNSYGTSSTSSVRPGSSPRKNNSPRRVVSSPRKHPQSPRGAKRGALAPTSLASYFVKMGQSTNKESTPTAGNEQPAAPQKVSKANEGSKKHRSAAATTVPAEKHNEEPNKKTATSLILFEEVDVIFDDDLGFLAAIKTFMTTAKRPVILTTSDPAFNTMFDGSFEELHFERPSVLNVGSYLQLLCLAEDMRTDPSDVGSLLRLNGCDVRQSLLQLQFWTRSAGDDNMAKPSVRTSKDETAELKPENKEASLKSPTVPFTSAQCVESKLGMLNIEPERHIWELLENSSLVEDAVCWELLASGKRRGVDLLYANMERLLPLPLTQLSASTRKAELCAAESNDCSLAGSKQQETPASLQSSANLLPTAEAGDCSDGGSPIKVSNRMRKKRRHCSLDQEGIFSDSEERFVSLSKRSDSPEAKEEVGESSAPESVKRKPLTPEERAKSVPVSQCLQSLADFFDNMSYTDSCLSSNLEEGGARRQTSPVGMVFKDGMSDESREDTDRGSRLTECALEIQAAVEALSFHRCRAAVTEAWDRTQKLEAELKTEAAAELSLPVAAHQEGYSLFQDGPCPPQLVQQRGDVMETLALRGVFGSPFSRAAAALDYLPIIRTICRSEQLKEQGKVKRRFLHYLDVIHMALDKSTLQLLAEDFP